MGQIEKIKSLLNDPNSTELALNLMLDIEEFEPIWKELFDMVKQLVKKELKPAETSLPTKEDKLFVVKHLYHSLYAEYLYIEEVGVVTIPSIVFAISTIKELDLKYVNTVFPTEADGYHLETVWLKGTDVCVDKQPSKTPEWLYKMPLKNLTILLNEWHLDHRIWEIDELQTFEVDQYVKLDKPIEPKENLEELIIDLECIKHWEGIDFDGDVEGQLQAIFPHANIYCN